MFLGVANFGDRPDVAGIYGEQFLKSGYGLAVDGLSPGGYTLRARAERVLPHRAPRPLPRRRGLVALNVYSMHRYAKVKPLVIRIDDIGRAQAITYDALNYRPAGQAPELKYFLVQFITKHYGRMRATVKTQYAESFFFLESALAEATIAHDRQTQGIEKFLTDTSDEIEIQVKNVTLDELKEAPYRATVEFDRVYYAIGNRQEHARETCVAHLTFVVRDQVPNAAIPINPLGLMVTYVRVDQAFK